MHLRRPKQTRLILLIKTKEDEVLNYNQSRNITLFEVDILQKRAIFLQLFCVAIHSPTPVAPWENVLPTSAIKDKLV